MRIRQFPDPEAFRQLSLKHNVIPVCAEILADSDTPVSILNKFYRRRGPAFLFESVEGGEQWGRYSFLGTAAHCHLKIYPDRVDIQNGSKVEKIDHNGDPLAVLRTWMQQYHPPQMPNLPRFWGGLVGYLTYEMVTFFESIPSAIQPQTLLGHFVIPAEMLIFDNIRHTLLVVVLTFPGAESPADKAFQKANERIAAMLERIDSPPATAVVRTPGLDLQLAPRHAAEQYLSHVRNIKQRIRAGDVIQTVVSQPFVCDPPPDLLELYRAQRYINPSPYLYFLHLDEVALVGSSPETLVRLENGVATLRPIAGTRPRGQDERQDRNLADELLQDEKERAEHLMLVDLGRNDLGRVAATGSVQVTDLMVVERYSHVMHLVSNIICDLRSDRDAWDLLRAVFPAGTLSGAPKIMAMKIIAELEKELRGPYGGAVGYISFDGNMDTAITIRTACVQNGQLVVRAGAGIVADSDPQSEYTETVNKAMALQKALQLVAHNVPQGESK